MKYCSQYNKYVLDAKLLIGIGVSITSLLKVYEWKQLVLPGFEEIMGV